MKATANAVYYTSKTLANCEHPLMIRYCKDGKKKYKSLGVIEWNIENHLENPDIFLPITDGSFLPKIQDNLFADYNWILQLAYNYITL